LLSAQSQFAFREEEIYGSFVSDFHIDGLHLSKLNNAFYFAPHQCLSGSGGIEGCLWKLCNTIPFSYRICSFTDWKVSANGLSVGLGSPAKLHVYDSIGRHTGINKQGGIDTEIPGSEFYMFRDIQQQLAFLPNLDLSGGYTIDIEGLADSVFDLNILYPNRADGNAYNVAYFERPTKKGALHRVDLNANNNWTMANDLNGDSIFESQTAPDFTAEAALDTKIVTISNVSSKTSGDSATISWHTNVPSTSKVLYRSEHDSIYQSIADTILTTSHSISVDSLSTTEIYYYVVVSIDTSGNIASFLEKSLKLYVVGDPNADRNINLADAIYLANYLLKGGSSPVPVASGDVNSDGKIDLVDVIKLARYVLLGEPFPC
jgi:hypothetical protein